MAGNYAGWLVAFCAAMISPAILIYGLPLAIGALAQTLWKSRRMFFELIQIMAMSTGDTDAAELPSPRGTFRLRISQEGGA